VCLHRERPSVPAAVKREVLARYGFTSWSGKTGEIDRVPCFLGGQTTVSNLWPEAGPIPNRKHALERYVRNFLADWVTYSRRYGL
jgi:hypothetical protein